MNPFTSRRAFLGSAVAAGGLATHRGWAASFSADGPARSRAGALKGVLLDVALAGTRLVAVGERGHVLLSDDAGKSWRQAQAVPTRSTLTSLFAADAKALWATGHGGMVLHSADAGENWRVVAGKASGADVLLAIRVQPDGHGLAVGGFGTALATEDGGRQWKAIKLVEGEAGEKHLNRILVTRAGTWLVAAESGLVLRGSGGPALAQVKWAAVKTPYAGSLWSGLQLPSGPVVLGGMRGNVVSSSDEGLSWAHQPVPEAGSLTGAAVLKDGRVVLVGVDGTLVQGDAAGGKLRLTRLEDRATLTAVVALPAGGLVASSLAGMRNLSLPVN